MAYVKKPDPRIDALEAGMAKLTGLVTAIAEKIGNAPKQVEAVKEATPAIAPEGAPEVGFISPQWRAYVDEKLGPDFGISVKYPSSGGFHFTIIVPREKSNASKEHWAFYKTDLRTKAIDPSIGFDGVKAYVDLVAKNLRINKPN